MNLEHVVATQAANATIKSVRIMNAHDYGSKVIDNVSSLTPMMDLFACAYMSRTRAYTVFIYVYGKPRQKKQILIFDESVLLGHLVYHYYGQEYWQRHSLEESSRLQTFSIVIERPWEAYSSAGSPGDLLILATAAEKRTSEELDPPPKRIAVSCH